MKVKERPDTVECDEPAILETSDQREIVFEYGNSLRRQVDEYRETANPFDSWKHVPARVRPYFWREEWRFPLTALRGIPNDISWIDDAGKELFTTDSGIGNVRHRSIDFPLEEAATSDAAVPRWDQ